MKRRLIGLTIGVIISIAIALYAGVGLNKDEMLPWLALGAIIGFFAVGRRKKRRGDEDGYYDYDDDDADDGGADD